MAKVSAKKVLSTVKREADREWSLVSYSIDKRVLASFKRTCDREGVKASRVIEEFMKEFTGAEGK